MAKATSRNRRNTEPMRSSPRCGAKTRARYPCKSPSRCRQARGRMHGGLKGYGGADREPECAEHGGFTKEAKKLRAEARRVLQEIRSVLARRNPRDSLRGAPAPSSSGAFRVDVLGSRYDEDRALRRGRGSLSRTPGPAASSAGTNKTPALSNASWMSRNVSSRESVPFS